MIHYLSSDKVKNELDTYIQLTKGAIKSESNPQTKTQPKTQTKTTIIQYNERKQIFN
jgi:hypothetical protein